MFLTGLGALILGLFIGSFLLVVADRLHAKRSFVYGRSDCPSCHHKLGPLELIPLISWLALGGRCKHCKKPIPAKYPLVELLTGLVFLLTVSRHLPSTPIQYLNLALWLFIGSSFVVLAVYDLQWYILPDRVLLPLIAPALVIASLTALQTHSWQVLIGPIVAALIFGGGFFGIAAISGGRWMGGGDIKLAFIMGLLLGIQKTALAMFIAFNAAAIVGLTLIALKRKTRRDMIPFGPFLIAGTLVAYWFGGDIINWYLRISGLYLLQ